MRAMSVCLECWQAAAAQRADLEQMTAEQHARATTTNTPTEGEP